MAERIFNPPITAPNFATGYWAQLEGRRLTDMSQPSVNIRLTRQGQAYTRPGRIDTGWDIDEAGFVASPYRMIRYGATLFAINTKVYYREDRDQLFYDTGLALTAAATPVSTYVEYAGDVFVGNATDGWNRLAFMTLNGDVDSADTFIEVEVSAGIRVPVSGNIRIQGTNIPFDNDLDGSVSNAANNGSGLIRITTGAAHGLYTGDSVTIASVGGTTEANGTWTITVIDATNFDLQGSAFANAYTSGGTWDLIDSDRLHLTGTAGQDYDSGTIAVYVDTTVNSTIPKGAKAVEWKESMNMVGVTAAVSGYDLPRHTHFYSDFAAATSGGLAKFYAFSGGKSGAQPLGVTGELTNVVSTVDRLFLFKEDSSYFIRVGDVLISDGTRPANIFSPRYGSVNQFTAVEMEGSVVFMTKNKRIIKSSSNAPSPTASGGSTGAGLPAQGQMFPDESFDRPIYELLLALDDDQSSARMHYWSAGRLLFIVCKIGGQKVALIYDNNVGVWLPPNTNFSFNGFFEIEGKLYAVSDNDDAIYEMEVGSADAGAPIECVLATGILRVQKGKGEKGFATCDFEETEFIGTISQGTDLFYHPIIDATKEGNEKTIQAEDVATFGGGTPIGSIAIGSLVIGGSGQIPERAPFSARRANVPSVGTGIQLIWRTQEDGHSFGIDGYKIYGREFTDSFAETH